MEAENNKWVRYPLGAAQERGYVPDFSYEAGIGQQVGGIHPQQISTLIALRYRAIWRILLTARKSGFQSDNRGSIPLCATVGYQF